MAVPVSRSTSSRRSARGKADDGNDVGLFTVGFPGDANMDNTIGNADSGTVLGNFRATNVGWSGGDLDGNGVVGNSDFGIVLGNFGSSSATVSLSSAEEFASFPAPSTLLMAMTAEEVTGQGIWRKG